MYLEKLNQANPKTMTFKQIIELYNQNFELLRSFIVTMGDKYESEVFTNSNETIINLEHAYSPTKNNLFVYINGVLQQQDKDYREVSTTSIELLGERDYTDVIKVIIIQSNLLQVSVEEYVDQLSNLVNNAKTSITIARSLINEGTLIQDNMKKYYNSVEATYDSINKLAIDLEKLAEKSNSNLTTSQGILNQITDLKNAIDSLSLLTPEQIEGTEVVEARSGFPILGSRLDRMIYQFDTVDDMKTCLALKEGDRCLTCGENAIGDDSTKVYKVSSAENIPEGADEVYELGNGLRVYLLTIMPQKAAIDAKYAKPTSGVPKADLAQEVQDSLDKADKIDALKGDIDNIKKVVLAAYELSLKKTDFTVGSFQTASFAVDVTKTHALTYLKHIDANENDVIKITVPAIDGVYYKYRFGFYDESKAYIGQEAFTAENPYTITRKNTKYIAFCIIAYNQADDTNHANLIDEFSATDIIKYENLSKSVATMEDIVSDIAELQNKKRVYRHMVNAAMKPKNITSNGYLSQLQPLALFHFSDIHGDAIETERISSVYQDIVDKCDDVICTGDIVELRYSNDATFMTDGSRSKKYLLAIGNHDVLTDESGFDFTQRATQEQQYEKFFAKNIANWGVTYTENKTYYYKDYAAKKIRLIVLNNMLTSTDSTEQLTWLETTLADSITNDYSVVIGMHYPVYGFTKIDCAFTRRDREIPSSDCADVSICQKVQTFIDNGGDFICYIGGHKHGDYIGYSSAYPSQISILVDSASRAQSNQYSDLMRVDDELSQDVYNVVVSDKSVSAIKLIRIGCDVDNYMRRRDMICLDYRTKEILSCGLPVYTGGVQ